MSLIPFGGAGPAGIAGAVGAWLVDQGMKYGQRTYDPDRYFKHPLLQLPPDIGTKRPYTGPIDAGGAAKRRPPRPKDALGSRIYDREQAIRRFQDEIIAERHFPSMERPAHRRSAGNPDPHTFGETGRYVLDPTVRLRRRRVVKSGRRRAKRYMRRNAVRRRRGRFPRRRLYYGFSSV